MHILHWDQLNAEERRSALSRPARANAAQVDAQVKDIIEQVRTHGDVALRQLTQRFDGVQLDALQVTAQEFKAAAAKLSGEQHAAIETAIGTVTAFHAAQRATAIRVETAPGVICERMVLPIRTVGLYVPAGSAPLPSTAIMLAVPARIAGCAKRILCTAPGADGNADAAVLVAAHKADVSQVFKVGGAQAVAAMAYGTHSVPKCDKIFGPGNTWVTSAKLQVAQDPCGAALDLPAGVSEVMVIADAAANAEFVAADLLAQAEHGVEAQAILVTDSRELAAAVAVQVRAQMRALSRVEILKASVANMRLIVAASLDAAFEIANEYAAEHLIIEVQDARAQLPKVANAGAVFLGNWSPESIGDYCGGPNHTLPTYGFARAYSGLNLEDFQKRISVQELSRDGLRNLGPTAQILANLEGLDGHAAAVTRRLQALAASST